LERTVAKMKAILTHTLCALIGFFLAGLVFLFMSSLTSFAWQDSIKIRASYSLQVAGAKAAQKGDLSLAGHLFFASDIIQSQVHPKQWHIAYPLQGWRSIGLVKDPDDTFYLPDLAVEAYLLEKHGKIDDANIVYAKLLKLEPSKDKTYFRSIAIQMLSAFEKG